MLRKDTWLKVFCISLIGTIILFVMALSNKDGSAEAKTYAVLAGIGIITTLISVVMFNIANAKEQEMNASQYLKERFDESVINQIHFGGGGGSSSSNGYADGYHGCFTGDPDDIDYMNDFDVGMMKAMRDRRDDD